MKKQLIFSALFIGMTATTLGGGVLLIHHFADRAKVRYPSPAQVTATLEDINTTDSTDPTTGEWRGLCQKDSIHSVADLRATIDADPTLKAHFADLNLDIAKVEQLSEPTRAVVYHRKGAVLAPTSRAITLPAGDKYITDGATRVRMHCCNDYTPLPPVNTPPVFVPPAPPVQTYLPPTFGPPVETPPTYYTTFVTPNIITGSVRHHTTPPAPVPEPNTFLLFGAGLGLLSFFGRRR